MEIQCLEISPNFSLKTERFSYISEGNCNIVISLIDLGLVLRLRKSETNDKVDDRNVDELELLKLESSFHMNVMRHLIGKIHTSPVTIVTLGNEDINVLLADINHKRPIDRKHKSLFCNYGILTTDYTSNKVIDVDGPTLCIEMKCKQGWMPSLFLKYNKCMYCIHQYLKLEKKLITEISEYCPLDLFSGAINRMSKAIDSLMSNPQNNFKIFISGDKVASKKIDIIESIRTYFTSYKEYECDILQMFKSILIKILLWNGTQTKFSVQDITEHVHKDMQNNNETCDPSNLLLPEGCVLDKILQIQLMEKNNILQENIVSSAYGYAEDLIRIFSSDENSTEITNGLSLLQKYMLATIAKDCSIMIALKPIQNKLINTYTNGIIINCDDNFFAVKLGVIDLDPKNTSKIQIHRKRDIDVVQSFEKFLHL